METTEETSITNNHPQITLLIENPKKNTNWGPLLRCCAAFGIAQIFVIGYDTCSVQGSHGASKHVELLSFPTHQQALDALTSHNYQLLGVLNGVANAYDKDGYVVVQEETTKKDDEKNNNEPIVNISFSPRKEKSESKAKIFPKSYPVNARQFYQNTCLVVGRRSIGLPAQLAELCHGFVHIPHQAQLNTNKSNNVSWLNGEACVSIILHEFSAWAKFDDSNYQGQKYSVNRIVKGSKENQTEKQNERKRKMEERLQETPPEDMANFFNPDGNDGGDY